MAQRRRQTYSPAFKVEAVRLVGPRRRIIWPAPSTRLETNLVMTAWHRALARRRTAPRWHHSDRGTQ
jgi:transposase-like protein